MSEKQTLVFHTCMIVCLAALLLLVVRNHRADIQILHERLDTMFLNQTIVPPPPAAEPEEAA